MLVHGESGRFTFIIICVEIYEPIMSQSDKKKKKSPGGRTGGDQRGAAFKMAAAFLFDGETQTSF